MDRRYVGIVVASIPFALCLVAVRLKMLLLIATDLLTGCKTRTVVGKVGYCIFPGIFQEFPGDVHRPRYTIYRCTLENNKKIRLFYFKRLYDFRFVKDNMHTIRILRYSHAVLEIKHGKKTQEM